MINLYTLNNISTQFGSLFDLQMLPVPLHVDGWGSWIRHWTHFQEHGNSINTISSNSNCGVFPRSNQMNTTELCARKQPKKQTHSKENKVSEHFMKKINSLISQSFTWKMLQALMVVIIFFCKFRIKFRRLCSLLKIYTMLSGMHLYFFQFRESVNLNEAKRKLIFTVDWLLSLASSKRKTTKNH